MSNECKVTNILLSIELIMKTEIISSIKLRLENIVNIKPLLIMKILSTEFVQLMEHEVKEIEDLLTERTDAGAVMFNQQVARLYRDHDSDTVYLRFESGRVYSLTINEY